MRRCVNDPAWAVETAQATGMCEACPGCTAQAQKEEKDRWNLGFFCMGNGITVCNRVGVGSEWPMVAHIRYNREVNLDNGELYSPETTPPPIEPQEVVVIKNY